MYVHKREVIVKVKVPNFNTLEVRVQVKVPNFKAREVRVEVKKKLKHKKKVQSNRKI